MRRIRKKRIPAGARNNASVCPKDGAPAEGLLGPIESVRGVGPKIARALERRGIHVIEDLLYFLPVRYEDKRLVQRIADVVEGQDAVMAGRVIDAGRAYSRATRKRLCYARIDDGTGTVILRWFRFNRGWVETVCKKGLMLFASGKVARYGADFQIVHPRVTLMEEGQDAGSIGSIFPVYPDVDGVKQGVLGNIIKEAFETARSHLATVIPERVALSHCLPALEDAFMRCHFPTEVLPDESRQDKEIERIILEEFFLFQISLLLKRKEGRKENGVSMRPGASYRHLMTTLPFRLTPGQERVCEEIEQDMAATQPMNRLLQGDVGCGKTVCAVLAAAIALDNGCQAVFMAPTEVLAEQHYLSIHSMLKGIGIEPVLVRGNMGEERNAVIDSMATGDARIIVGTHALLQPDVVFHRLGLAIIDEQHRFGVIQRSLLREKGANADVLVMSATPIPRTLSMVVYGDLDASLIEDMPSCRQSVRTEVVDETERGRVYDAVLGETGRGHQVFVVHPLIEESESAGMLGAKEGLREWHRLFPSLRMGLLHGRMRAEEKEEVMTAFRNGAIDLLVATTVIEVGIDIPNATLMVVEHAERFGLSQLHQLRGRVGRGSSMGRCILICASSRTTNATKRIRVLEKTNDGFAIAEEDMKLRGPGDMIGVRQAGIPFFRVGNIVRHGDLMSRARRMAEEALSSAGPDEVVRLEAAAERKWGERRLLGNVL